MTKDESLCSKCSHYLQSDYFNNKYLSWFFSKCRDYYNQYGHEGRLPSPQYLVDQIQKVIVKEEINNYAQILSKIISIPDNDKEYLIDELELFIKTSEFKKLHIKTADFYNNGEYDKAFDYTRERMNIIDEIKLRQDDYVTPQEIDEILERAQNNEDVEEVDIMGMSFPDYNNQPTWNGKIPKQGVTTVIAPWNTGKSTFLINSAYFAALSGKKVLFVFHEGRKSSIVLKFISRLTQIPYNALKAGLLNDEDRVKIEKAKIVIRERIRIKEATKVGNTVEDLYVYCKTVKQEFNFDILIDDYGQKLGVKRPKNQLRHDYLHIWNTLDQMAHELYITILTAAQINRDGSKANKKGDAIIRSENISETIAPAQVSEVVLTINRSSKDRISDKWILCLDKGRDSLDGLLIEVNSSFSRSITHDPKFGMNVIGYDTSEGREDI